MVDSSKVSSVIKSMVENAIKFNDKDKKKIWISVKKAEGFLEISVRDNGQGIPSEEYENVFKRFYQVEEYFTGQIEGAGLGLSFAKDIIERHKGSIKVKSKIGEGSTFTFTLPTGKK